MMPYFDKPANKEKLRSIIFQWVGVPYHHMGSSKSGVDCTKFIGLVLVEMGILLNFDKNVYYPTDWFVHGNQELCLNSMQLNLNKYLCKNLYAQIFDYNFIQNPELNFGDLVCIAKNLKEFVNHTAFYFGDNQIVHCLHGKGVFIGQFSFSFATRTKKVFRLFYKD